MTDQFELDDDLKCVLNAHLITRRDLLKRVKAEINKDFHERVSIGNPWNLNHVNAVMDRLITEAEMPQGGGKG